MPQEMLFRIIVFKILLLGDIKVKNGRSLKNG